MFDDYIDARNAKILVYVLKQYGLVVDQTAKVTERTVGFMNSIACLRWKEITDDDKSTDAKYQRWEA